MQRPHDHHHPKTNIKMNEKAKEKVEKKNKKKIMVKYSIGSSWHYDLLLMTKKGLSLHEHRH